MLMAQEIATPTSASAPMKDALDRHDDGWEGQTHPILQEQQSQSYRRQVCVKERAPTMSIVIIDPCYG